MSYILVYGDNWTNTGYCFENVNKLKPTDLFVCSDARVQFLRSSISEIRDLRHNFESSADKQNPNLVISHLRVILQFLGNDISRRKIENLGPSLARSFDS